jgi:hypothetical protein
METVLDMVFHAKSLCDDIAQFSMLLRHGDNEVGLNFVFKRLQDKIRTAGPTALCKAQDCYQLRLKYNHDFAEQIATAQNIAAERHAEGLLDQGSCHTTTVGRKHPRSDRLLDNAAKKKFKIGTSGGVSHPSQAKPLKAYVALAKEHDRCFGCGFYVAPGTLEEHKATCKRNVATFNRCMGQVQKQLEENPSANRNARYRDRRSDSKKEGRK